MSLTTPFFPTFSLPASNCGFISATTSPLSPKRFLTAGIIVLNEINDTSIDAKSNGTPISSGVTYLIFVLSMQTTLSSVLNFQANCP